MTDEIRFRPAGAEDSRPCFAIMRGALHDFMQRAGQVAPGAPAPDLDERWARDEGLFGHLAATCSQRWLAEDGDGRPVGYARSIECDATVELTEFFVSAAARGSGVGRELLERAFAPGSGRHRCIIATTEPAASTLYLRFGVEHQTTGIDIVGTPRAIAVPAGFEAAPATLDLTVPLAASSAVSHLLGRGFRLTPFGTHFLADGPWAKLDRYLPLNPCLFL